MMISLLPVVLCALPLVVQGQTNKTLSLSSWTTNACCGTVYAHWNDIKLGECVTTGADSDVLGFGQTVTVDGLWTTEDNRFFTGVGYAVGWENADCTGPKTDYWFPNCWWPPAGHGRPKSFSWRAKNYTVSYVGPWVPDADGTQGGELRMAKPRKADWFKYFDEGLGRSRKVRLEGDVDGGQKVLTLYGEGKFEELRSVPEIL